jgi:hypothetical protein
MEKLFNRRKYIIASVIVTGQKLIATDMESMKIGDKAKSVAMTPAII